MLLLRPVQVSSEKKKTCLGAVLGLYSTVSCSRNNCGSWFGLGCSRPAMFSLFPLTLHCTASPALCRLRSCIDRLCIRDNAVGLIHPLCPGCFLGLWWHQRPVAYHQKSKSLFRKGSVLFEARKAPIKRLPPCFELGPLRTLDWLW